MYIYKRFDKVLEGSLFVIYLLLLYRSVVLANALLVTSLYVLAAAYFGGLVVRHWRMEFSSQYFRAAYRRVLLLLESLIDTGFSYQVISPDKEHVLYVESCSQPWPRRGSVYRVSIVTLEPGERDTLEPFDMLSFMVPPPHSYVVADRMVRHQAGEGMVSYTRPVRPFWRTLKLVLLDRRPDNEMIVTEAELAYVENALLTWHQQVDCIAD